LVGETGAAGSWRRGYAIEMARHGWLGEIDGDFLEGRVCLWAGF